MEARHGHFTSGPTILTNDIGSTARKLNLYNVAALAISSRCCAARFVSLGHHGSNEVGSLEHCPGSEHIVPFRQILPAAKLRCMGSIGRQEHCASPNDNDAQLAHELAHSAVVKG